MGIWKPPPRLAAIFNKPGAERTGEDSLLWLEWIERAEPRGTKFVEGEGTDESRDDGRVIWHRPRKEDVFRSVSYIQQDDIEDDWAAYTQGRIELADVFEMDRTEFHETITRYDPCRGMRFENWLKKRFRQFAGKREKRRRASEEVSWPDGADGGPRFDPPDGASHSGPLEPDSEPDWDRLSADLKRVLHSLSARDQLVIEIRFLDEEPMDNAAVARVLGVTKGAAAVIVHRALRRIQERLNLRCWSEAQILSILDERKQAHGHELRGDRS